MNKFLIAEGVWGLRFTGDNAKEFRELLNGTLISQISYIPDLYHMDNCWLEIITYCGKFVLAIGDWLVKTKDELYSLTEAEFEEKYAIM